MTHAPNHARREAKLAGGLAGAKPTIGLGYLDDPHDVLADGRVHAIELTEAPGYVVPFAFTAWWTEAFHYPVDVTIEIEVRPWTGPVFRRARLEARYDPAQGSDLFDSPHEYVGMLPGLPVPTMVRDATAYAAMPADSPYLEEMGTHAPALLEMLPVKRAPRVSRWERLAIRGAYEEALSNPELSTKFQQREYVFEVLHRGFPDEWPRGDGRVPDYDRLRPFLAELDRERGT